MGKITNLRFLLFAALLPFLGGCQGAGEWLYFYADPGTGSSEVWRTNGTTIASTGLVADPNAPITAIGTKALFVSANDGVTGFQPTLLTNPH